jgi:hypothetical protein
MNKPMVNRTMPETRLYDDTADEGDDDEGGEGKGGRMPG